MRAVRNLVRPLLDRPWQALEVWLHRKSDNLLWLAASAGTDAPYVRRFLRSSRALVFAPGLGMPGLTWRRQRPEWIHDLAADRTFRRSGLASLCLLESGAAVPLPCRRGVVVAFSREPRALHPPSLARLRKLAAMLDRVLASGRTA
jgi:hypothetical protein